MMTGQIGQHRVLEQVANRRFEVQALPQTRDNPQHQQRVPTKLEEVVPSSDAVELKKFGPDRGQRGRQLPFTMSGSGRKALMAS
jgi:hypothetical protein